MPLETQSMLSTKCLPCSQYYVKNVKLSHHNSGTNYFKKTYLPFLWHWNWEAVSLVRKKPFRMKTTGRKQRKELQQSVEGNHSKGVIHFTKVLILSYILWRSHLLKFRKKKKRNWIIHQRLNSFLKISRQAAPEHWDLILGHLDSLDFSQWQCCLWQNYFETSHTVAQAGLEFTMYLRLASTSQPSSCFGFSFKGMIHIQAPVLFNYVS